MFAAPVPWAPKDATPLSKRGRLVAASVNFALTAHTALTVAVGKMLHCVRVPGMPHRRLFLRASVVCDFGGWQLPYVLLLLLLAVAPVGVVVAARCLRRGGDFVVVGPSSMGMGSEGGGRARLGPRWCGRPGWGEDIRRGAERALVASYKDRAYWWEFVLIYQRLVRAVRRAP